MNILLTRSCVFLATTFWGLPQNAAGLLRHSAGNVRQHQDPSVEQRADEFLQKVYTRLHSNETSDVNFLGDTDDAEFAKLYGDKALQAEGYGEITFQGLASLLSHGVERHGSFMDLGSGLGRSVIYACLAGGFEQCDGVELSGERSELAKQALAEVKIAVPWMSNRVRLFHGDMLAFPEYFEHDVILANNLLLPDIVQDGIAKQFSHTSQPGTVLFTSKELPLSTSVASMTRMSAGVTWQQGAQDFWFKYVRTR